MTITQRLIGKNPELKRTKSITIDSNDFNSDRPIYYVRNNSEEEAFSAAIRVVPKIIGYKVKENENGDAKSVGFRLTKKAAEKIAHQRAVSLADKLSKETDKPVIDLNESKPRQETYWYIDSQSHDIFSLRDEFYERNVNLDGENLTRDEEIQNRYEVMVEHYEENPELLARGENYRAMSSLWASDRVLKQNKDLKSRLGKILVKATLEKSKTRKEGSK